MALTVTSRLNRCQPEYFPSWHGSPQRLHARRCSFTHRPMQLPPLYGEPSTANRLGPTRYLSAPLQRIRSCQGTSMSAQPQNPSPTPNVRLACIELSRFRRLAQTQVKIDKKTTILVGANNSGKTRTATSTRRCRLPWRRSQPRRRWTYSPWCRSSSKSARVPRPALFLLQPPEMLFLDTEFLCAADDGELLSIGIVGDSCEFYAELDEDGVASVLRGHRRNRFLQQAVLPQFGRVLGARHTLDGMAQAAARWLASRDGDALKVAYDYSMDFSLLERLLANSYGSVLARLVPVHVGYLLDDPLGKEAAVASWSATDKLRGLRRHHASCRYLGVEGALRGRTWRVTWGAGMASSVAVSKTSAADNAPPKQSGRASSTPDERQQQLIVALVRSPQGGQIPGPGLIGCNQIAATAPGERRFAQTTHQRVGHHAGMPPIPVGKRMNPDQVAMKACADFIRRERGIFGPPTRVVE